MNDFKLNPYLTEVSALINLGPWGNWLIVFAAAVGLTILVRFLCFLCARRFEQAAARTENKWDDIALGLVAKTKAIVIFAWFFYLMLPVLDAKPSVEKTVHSLFVIATTFQFTLWSIYFVGAWREHYLSRRIETDASSVAAMGILTRIFQALAAIVVILTGLKQMNIDIGALVAGLGVGGVAVALAAQNVLGDLLASVSIILDKPFVTGDFIVVGQQMGAVEYIGIKSTRVRSLSGELLIFSNRDLLASRIQNFKQMMRRRASLKLSIPIWTPVEKLDSVTQWVKEVADQEPKVTLDHCNFIQFGDGTYDFEFAFFISDPDANLYLALQQKMIVKIGQKFKAEGVEFAMPARSMVVRPT